MVFIMHKGKPGSCALIAVEVILSIGYPCSSDPNTLNELKQNLVFNQTDLKFLY